MEMLDMKCAEFGNKIAIIHGNTDSFIQKSLGVLQEDGVYAFFLYMKAQKKPYANEMIKKAYEFLNQDEVLRSVFRTETDELKAVREKLANNLDHLLFAKELLERTLVYARYHAKAFEGKKSESTTVESGV